MEVSNLFKELPFSTHAIDEEVTIILQEMLSNVLSADKDMHMSESDNEEGKPTIIKNLIETNTKHLEKIDELKEKFRLKVKELRITQAIVISKDLQIISLQTKIAEIEKTKELPFATHEIEEEILSNVLSADKDMPMSESDNEEGKPTIIKNLIETNTKHLEKIDELKEKFRLKVKELRITQAIVISKDLQIISLETKIAEIEKTKELPFSTHEIEEEEILSNVSSAESTVQSQKLQTKAPAGGDMNVTNEELIKIHTEPKRRGLIGKTWRRVKRAATFLCCFR